MYGYVDHKDQVAKRLRRIEGQVRGLQQMIEEDRYCIDILTQISAATKALQAVAVELMGADGEGGLMGSYVLGLRGDRPDAGRGRRRQGRAPGELSRIEGIRVPAGFCVTTDAFRRIMADAPSIDEQLDRLSRLSPDDREAIRTLSARSAGPSKGSPSPTIWRRRSPARSPGSASTPPTPSGPARRRRTCRRPPSPASRTRT
jgi:hypothetical protein